METLTTNKQSDATRQATVLDECVSTFSEIFDLPVVVAGGAVRDSLLGLVPKDFDVFMLGQSWEKWKDYQEQFGEKFAGKLSKFPKVESKVEWHKSEPFLLESISFDGREVQLMASPEPTLRDLISTFDWGVCCFGYDGSSFIYEPSDLEAIKHGEYLRLNKVTYPFSTLRRGYRFSERFEMQIKREDLLSICNQIIKKGITEE